MSEDLLREMFQAAVDAALPSKTVPSFLPEPPAGRTVVIGAGKASAAMAACLEENWGTDLSGVVVTRYDHAVPCNQIKIIEAAHPVPDANSARGAREVLEAVQGLSADDLVIALISGGGSALLSLPANGVSLEDKQSVNSALLKSGATITEMNIVRRHLSAIKGGRLAAAVHPARLVTLMISDVPGDDPCVIASGPTVPDATSLEDACNILKTYQIAPPKAVADALELAANETLKPDDPVFGNTQSHMIARPQASLEAAADVARQAGFTPLILGDALEGEAREMGTVMAGMALQVQRYDQPLPRPCVLISGGEATVTVRGGGRGGRNVEFLAGLLNTLKGAPGISAIACDTDGVDGAEEVAGAVITPDCYAKSRNTTPSLEDALSTNDTHGLFKALGTQVITGPTLTNVNDFRAILIT